MQTRTGDFEFEYEHVVVALGAIARMLPIAGLAERGLAFKSLADAIALRNHVLGRLDDVDGAAARVTPAAAPGRHGMRSRDSEPLRRSAWLVPAVFALHVAEEAPGFTRWARRHASPRYSQREFVRNNAAGLALTLAGTAALARRPTRPVVFAYFATVLTQQALWNTVFHAATTVAYRAYSPGLVSAVGGFLPLWWGLSRHARRAGLLPARAELGAAAIGGAIHATAVAQQVYGWSPSSSSASRSIRSASRQRPSGARSARRTTPTGRNPTRS